MCYQKCGTGPIIVLKLAVNGYFIPIWKWRYHSHMIALNYACNGNETDKIKMFGVLHVIIAIPPEVV